MVVLASADGVVGVTAEFVVVVLVVALTCPLADSLTEVCRAVCTELVAVRLTTSHVEVDCTLVGIVVGVDSVARATSVVDSADEVLCSTDVRTNTVERETSVVGSADEVICVTEAGATCVLLSPSVVGCAEPDKAWTGVVVS